MALNKVQIIGNLGRDPEMRYATTGTAICNFSVAVTEKWGENETTEWFNCVAFKKLAETLEKYLSKGSKVYIEGKLKTNTWDKEDGTKGYKTEVIVREFEFLSPKKEASNNQGNDYNPGANSQGQPQGDDPNDPPF